MYYTWLLAIIILLVLLIIYFSMSENLTVDNIDFDKIFSGGAGKMVYPELDAICREKHNDSNAFYDGDSKKCYTCKGAERNPAVIAGEIGSCKAVSYSPAEIINTNTCKEDNNNWYHYGSGCFECPNGYNKTGLFNNCSSGETYEDAYIGDEAEGPGGLEYCPGGYNTNGGLCWKCPSGFKSRIGLVEDDRKCVDKRPASSIEVKSCKQQYLGKIIDDYTGDDFRCVVAGCGAYRYSSGATENWCWGCPSTLPVRNLWHNVNSSKACQNPDTNSWGPVRWIRKCKAVSGYPTDDAYPGYTLAGNKYWKCPDGYKKVVGIWEDKNICQKFSPAEYYERETCEDKYAGETVIESFINKMLGRYQEPLEGHIWESPYAINTEEESTSEKASTTSNNTYDSKWLHIGIPTSSTGVSSTGPIPNTSTTPNTSNTGNTLYTRHTYDPTKNTSNTPNTSNNRLVLSDTAVGWDPIGNCFACPDGFLRTGFSINSDKACMKPSKTTDPSLRRSAIGNGGCAIPNNIKNYHGPVDGCNFWKCPPGYDNMILKPYNSSQKCVKRVSREPAQLLGEI